MVSSKWKNHSIWFFDLHFNLREPGALKSPTKPPPWTLRMPSIVIRHDFRATSTIFFLHFLAYIRIHPSEQF